MSGSAPRLVRFAAALTFLAAMGWMLTLNAASPAKRRVSLPTDWSHSHLIFSQPSTAEEARLVQRDPRFAQQWQRRNQAMTMRMGNVAFAPSFEPAAKPAVRRGKILPSGKMRVDWSQSLGSVTTGALTGVYPAKFSFHTTVASCANDFVVYSTGSIGSSTQATIVAYNNLYSSCPTGTVPSPNWAYNITDLTHVNEQILTSPVLSLDGTQVAFAADNGFFGSVVLLKWHASTTESVTAPITPTSVATPAAYRACIAPCMLFLDLKRGDNNTQTRDLSSSVFYDYDGDVAWVGDSQGWLHKFTGVFNGTPTESFSSSGPFPALVSNGLSLSSPVYDSVSGDVFVSDAAGVLDRVSSSAGAVTASVKVDFGIDTTTFPITPMAAPMVDSSRGLVYVLSSADGIKACNANTVDCAGVFRFPAAFTSSTTPTEVTVGSSTDPAVSFPNRIFEAGVDSTYINSTDGTGNFYVCGNTGAIPTLYQVPIAAGALGTPVAIATLGTTGSSACSPVSDVPAPSATAGNAATERLFLSVQGNSNASNCAGSGCVQNFIDTPWQASTAFSVGQEILVTSTSAPTLRFINVVIATTGDSRTGAAASEPSWPSTAGVTRPDNNVTWMNQGNVGGTTSAWQALHGYTVGTRILDGNNNFEIVTNIVLTGLSGAIQPTWPTTAGTTTTDGTVTWTNAGALFTNSFAVTGGASGIIIDNTVDPGTVAGASQVYFSTLANQSTACGTGVSCAVQTSQATLH